MLNWTAAARSLALGFIGATTLTGAAAQGLIGDDVEIRFFGPNLDASSIVTVQQGIPEVTCPGSVFCNPPEVGGLNPGESIDIEETWITLVFNQPWSEGQFLSFEGLDLPGGIAAFSLASNIDWLTTGDITIVDPTSILVDLGFGGSLDTGSARITLLSEQPVDEPGSLALLGIGASALAVFSMRRRQGTGRTRRPRAP